MRGRGVSRWHENKRVGSLARTGRAWWKCGRGAAWKPASAFLRPCSPAGTTPDTILSPTQRDPHLDEAGLLRKVAAVRRRRRCHRQPPPAAGSACRRWCACGAAGCAVDRSTAREGLQGGPGPQAQSGCGLHRGSGPRGCCCDVNKRCCSDRRTPIVEWGWPGGHRLMQLPAHAPLVAALRGSGSWRHSSRPSPTFPALAALVEPAQDPHHRPRRPSGLPRRQPTPEAALQAARGAPQGPCTGRRLIAAPVAATPPQRSPGSVAAAPSPPAPPAQAGGRRGAAARRQRAAAGGGGAA